MDTFSPRAYVSHPMGVFVCSTNDSTPPTRWNFFMESCKSILCPQTQKSGFLQNLLSTHNQINILWTAPFFHPLSIKHKWRGSDVKTDWSSARKVIVIFYAWYHFYSLVLVFPNNKTIFSCQWLSVVESTTRWIIQKKRMWQLSSVSFPMSPWQHPVLCWWLPKKLLPKLPRALGRVRRWRHNKEKTTDSHQFSVDVDVHGLFSTGWTKQKFVMWTGPWTDLRYLFTALFRKQIFGDLFRLEFLDFRTVEDDFRKNE